MAETQCPQCGAANRTTARFCAECGGPLLSGALPASEPTRTGLAAAIASSASAGQPVTQFVLVGRYRIERELGRGGFGAVYEAWDENLNHTCAVKENMETSPEAQRQFKREATVLANLSHPNLPRVTDHFSITGQGQYLVMDYVEGEDLAGMLDARRPMRVKQVIEWIIQVADALVYLHSRQPAVVHRDIKPANIRITPEGKAMLVDFGLVKISDTHMQTTLGARAISPGYAPPEQYGRGSTDARTDLYALGATLYAALSGRQPLESVRRLSGAGMQPCHECNPEVPLAVSQAIERVLDLDPERRFQTAAEFKAVLVNSLQAAAGPVLVAPVGAEPVAAMPHISAPGVPAAPDATLAGAAQPGAGTFGVGASGAVPTGVGAAATMPHASDALPQTRVVPPAATIGQPAAMQPSPAAFPATEAAATASFVAHPAAIPPTAVVPPAPRSRRLWLALGGAAALVCLGLAFFAGLFAIFQNNRNHSQATTKTPLVVAPQPTRTEVTKLGNVTVTPNLGLAAPVEIVHSADPEQYVHLVTSEPTTLDPALAYDSDSWVIMQNVYDTLLFYYRDDPNQLIPQLAEEVPSLQNGGISGDGRTITFRLRPGVHFHEGNPLTPEDVAYTFRRNLLQGGGPSPQFLFSEPLLGVGIYDITELVGEDLQDNPEALQNADPARLEEACRRVMEAISFDNAAGTVTFHLAQPWGPFLTTLATGPAAVMSREWVQRRGGWDGNCGTWQKYYGRAADQPTDLDRQAMGSGPYVLDHWTAGQEIVLRANENYWRTQPAWGDGPTGPPQLKIVAIRLVDDLDTRLARLQKKEADSAEGFAITEWSRLNYLVGKNCILSDLDCQPTSHPDAPLEMIQGQPQAFRYDLAFNWAINTEGGNDLIGSGRLDGNGIPAEFFSNPNIRRAFAYCFNYERYLNGYLLGEGLRSTGLIMPGMLGYNPDGEHFGYDPGRCEDEFHQAQVGGRTVWDTGFRVVMPYVESVAARRVAAQILQDELARVNPKFKLELQELPVTELARLRRDGKLPLFLAGWIEDIHDPHNWVEPFMTNGYAWSQNLPDEIRTRLQDLAIKAATQANPDARLAVYGEFNQAFYDVTPSVPLFHGLNRQYQQRWVRGWYDNPAYPGLYFYVLGKD